MEKETFIALLVLTCITAIQVIATLCVGNYAFSAICCAVFIVFAQATRQAHKEWKEARNG